MVNEAAKSPRGKPLPKLEPTQPDAGTTLENAAQGVGEAAKPGKVEKKEEVKNVRGEQKKSDTKEAVGNKQTAGQPPQKNKSQKTPKIKGTAQMPKVSAENPRKDKDGLRNKPSAENESKSPIKSAYLCPPKPVSVTPPAPTPIPGKCSAEVIAPPKPTAKNPSMENQPLTSPPKPNGKNPSMENQPLAPTPKPSRKNPSMEKQPTTGPSKRTAKHPSMEKQPLTAPSKPNTITAPRPSSKNRKNRPSMISGKKSPRNSNRGGSSEKSTSKRKRATAQAKKLFRRVSSRSARKTWGSGRAGLEASKRSSRCKKNRREYFQAVTILVDVERDWEVLDVIFSYGMVVRFVGKDSPLLSYLIIGDQLIGIGTTEAENITMPLEPKNVEDALKEAKGSQLTITVIRPIGMTHCGAKEIPKRRDDCMYFVAELSSNIKPNDLLFGCMNGKAVVEKAEGAAGNVLMKDDRILEYNGQSTAKCNHPTTQTKSRDGPITCLVERSMGAPIINVGLSVAVKKTQQPTRMGDDAREIGAREACRFRHYTDFVTTVPPITRKKMSAERKSEERLGKNLLAYSRFGITEKKEYSTTPTDVEDTSALQRVTASSGLDKFLGMFRKR